MKILHLATSMGGGAGRAALRITAAQNLFGIQATIQSRDAILKTNSSEVTSVPMNQLKRIESSAITFFQSNLVQKSSDLVTPLSTSNMNVTNEQLSKYDLINVHAFYNYLNETSLDKLSKLDKPVVFTLHDQRVLTGGCHYSRDCQHYKKDCSPCPQVKIPWNFLVSRSFRNQSELMKNFKNMGFVTPSNWLANICKDSAIGYKIPVSVIKNPIPSRFFNATAEKKISSTLRIGFMSANLNNPYKGLDVLIEALELLACQSQASYSIRLIGKGDVPKVSNLLQISQVEANSDEEVISELINLDVLVVSSTEDNSPSVIGEALSLGVRVIGSNVGGIPEILQKFGMPIFESKNANALAENLINLSHSHKVKEIRQLAKEEFGEIEIGKQYFEFYESLIQ